MIPFAPLAESLNKHAKAVMRTGATAQKIKAALDESNSKLPIYMEEDFDGALLKAKAIASEGDTVLLSPACASFDKFDNFEIRGRYFKDKVNNF
jgi:UDP-N-acetylmuramoylalanine--D-glutamate ligase